MKKFIVLGLTLVALIMLIVAAATPTYTMTYSGKKATASPWTVCLDAMCRSDVSSPSGLICTYLLKQIKEVSNPDRVSRCLTNRSWAEAVPQA